MSSATYRDAATHDIEAIANLHADSWRRNYRGAYSDEFLDHDVGADRLAVWTDRLIGSRVGQCTIVAVRDKQVVGFAHTVFDDDPEWGALLDNLHVAHDAQRQGIATKLLVETATRLIERAPNSGLYLWVLEGNTRAQAFYDARGGTLAGREVRDTSAGGGVVSVYRYAWHDVGRLLAFG